MNKLSFRILLEENNNNSDFDVLIMFYIDGIHFLPVASPWTVDIVKLLAHGQKPGRLDLLVNHHDDSTLHVETRIANGQIQWLKPSNLFLSTVHASYCITADVLYAFDIAQYLETLHKLKQELITLEHKFQRNLSLPGNGFYYEDWKIAIEAIANKEHASEFVKKLISELVPNRMCIAFNHREVYAIPSSELTKFIQQNTHGRIDLIGAACESSESLVQYLKNLPWDDLDILSWPIKDNIPLRSFTNTEWQNAVVTFE